MKTFRIMVIGIIAFGLICGSAALAAPVAKKQVMKIQPAPVSSPTAPAGQAPSTAIPKTKASVVQQGSKIIMPDFSMPRECQAKMTTWTLLDPKGKRLGNKKK